ncbi:hypothetical protein D3C75_808330 [compost metagenome]
MVRSQIANLFLREKLIKLFISTILLLSGFHCWKTFSKDNVVLTAYPLFLSASTSLAPRVSETRMNSAYKAISVFAVPPAPRVGQDSPAGWPAFRG